MLLATDNKGRTVFHVAADFCELDVFPGILNWAKENLIREEVNKLLLDTHNEGSTVFHVIRNSYNINVFHVVLNWAK